MLSFPEEYFIASTIDDFYVEETMKRAWAASLELLAEVDRICTKHGLRYFADWGTLLGAVRHHGFIPWDDDIDIAMPRRDLTTFASIAADELPDGWSFHNCHNTPGYYKRLARVITGDTIDFGEKRMTRFHGFPYPVGIDISPIDYIPENEEERDLQIALYRATASAMSVWLNPQSDEQQKADYLINVLELTGAKIDLDGDVPLQLTMLTDAISSMYREDETSICGQLHYMVTGTAVPKSINNYLTGTRVEFENTTIPIPLCYDEVLHEWYGDYMTKRQVSSSHDYPFYKSMREQAIKAGLITG